MKKFILMTLFFANLLLSGDYIKLEIEFIGSAVEENDLPKFHEFSIDLNTSFPLMNLKIEMKEKFQIDFSIDPYTFHLIDANGNEIDDNSFFKYFKEKIYISIDNIDINLCLNNLIIKASKYKNKEDFYQNVKVIFNIKDDKETTLLEWAIKNMKKPRLKKKVSKTIKMILKNEILSWIILKILNRDDLKDIIDIPIYKILG